MRRVGALSHGGSGCCADRPRAEEPEVNGDAMRQGGLGGGVLAVRRAPEPRRWGRLPPGSAPECRARRWIGPVPGGASGLTRARGLASRCGVGRVLHAVLVGMRD